MDIPVSNQPLTSEKTFFTSHERTREDKLMRYQHRERLLQNRIERIIKHPAKKDYQIKLQKREDTLKSTTAFIQKLASEENRLNGLSRQLKYSKRRRPKSKPTNMVKSGWSIRP